MFKYSWILLTFLLSLLNIQKQSTFFPMKLIQYIYDQANKYIKNQLQVYPSRIYILILALRIQISNYLIIVNIQSTIAGQFYNILLSTLVMKGKDLFTNIQEAREHINRLKKEAEILQSAPKDTSNNNINEYVNEVLYSLNKNQIEIDKKHKELKQKLPSIIAEKEENKLPLLNGYKKQKRTLNLVSKPQKQQSTKVEDSLRSFFVQNRQTKIYSHNEKGYKVDYSMLNDRSLMSQIEIPLESNINKAATPGSAHFRSRHFDKRMPKALDILQGSKLGSALIDSKMKRHSYLHNPNSSMSHNHDFQVIEGKIQKNSTQFASYSRIYESIIHKILEQLDAIEVLLINENIKFSKLDGKKLAYLCLKEKITKEQLYSCLANIPYRLKVSNNKGKYQGKEGKVKAVNKIIAFWRMVSIRDKYKILKKNTILIQNFFKRQLQKLNLQKKICKRNEKILDNFQKRQQKFARLLKQIKLQKRIQIHLNSIQIDEQKRLTIDNYSQRQNIQLSRIFRLKDQNLIIIYISKAELSTELLNYYYKMMELAGINNYRQRLIFLTPETSSMFPEHMSTTKLLYYASRTLNQLKIITSDLPTILYPGQPCNELLKICDYIDCYLYSGEPQKMKCFSTKSQTKRLLKNLFIQTLPSTMEMYDYGELLNTFSVLILKFPDIQTWVFKIDDEINGRGIAYVDLGSSKFVRNLLKKVNSQAETDTFATDVPEPQNQQVTVRIRDYLKDHLHQKLQISTPKVYKSYTHFMGRFIKKGGIIEAHPNCLKEQLGSIAATFELDPDGQFRIITSYEKINGQPFRPLACSFPQRIVEFSRVSTVIRQLCDSFKLRRMFGIFSVDFLYSKVDNKLWVLGIDPYLNDYSSSFYLFDLLMSGSYFPEKDVYLVQTQPGQDQALEDSLQSREYLFVPHLYHKNIGKVKIKDFFKAARMEKFNFDVGNKEGVCVMLLDQLTSGVMGLLSVSQNRQQSLQILKKMLDFISNISSVKNVDYGRNILQGSSDGVSLKDVLSVFSGMLRKGNRKYAKKHALKQHELKKNLQLIS